MDFLEQVRARAEVLMQQLTADSEQPDLWLQLSEHMAVLLRHDAVVACANEVLQRRPDDSAALTLKGNALRVAGQLDEAVLSYQRVLALRPDAAEAHCNLGAAYQTLGRYPEAIAAYEQAVLLNPDEPVFWGNLSVSLTYSPSHTPADVRTALRRFDEQLARPLCDMRLHTNNRQPERRIRVGYVSPDFRKHAVAYFALPLIEGHTAQVEVFCYYNHRQNDDWTTAFRKAASHWLDCAGMSDAELAERIRADGIDILVDLAGHTENNRLLTFARKPAPVQLTWMGYVTTTGMSAMDWRITHADADPEGADPHYSERLWRLPGTMWCYRPLPDMPEVSASPFARNGHITFGCFNRYSKNSPMVLAAWAQILSRVPDSQLVICVPEGEIRQQMARFFSERGIHTERLAAFAKLNHQDFWKLHGEVDIALDPFPFGGGTTTCETLWMGVPVVSVTGSEGGDFSPRFASRMGYAFLNNIGLPELVANTVSQYVDIAVRLAQDPERLAYLRASLRSKMASAPLTDEARFAREMEEAYRAMWRTWCSKL
jgi:predicted O-linked N-acetylglucosamine transferase (SPINDLY family)